MVRWSDVETTLFIFVRDDFSGFHPWLSSASPSLLPSLLVAVLFLVGVDDDADDSVSGASSLGAIMVTVMIAFTHALLRLTGRGERRWIIIMQIERDYDDDASLSSPPFSLCRLVQAGAGRAIAVFLSFGWCRQREKSGRRDIQTTV